MHIMVMSLAPANREKIQHITTLTQMMQADSSISLTVLCEEGSELQHFTEANGIQSLLLRSGLYSEATLRLKLFWRLRNNSVPVILLCLDQPAFNLALKLAHKRDHLKVVYSALRPEPTQIKKLAEKIHLVSAALANTGEIAEMLSQEGFLESRIYRLHSCIDPARYALRGPKDTDRIYFACSDSLEEGMGYEQLFKALGFLSKNSQLPSWELRIAAGGSQFEPLLELARELGVDGHIAIFGSEHGTDILHSCDILIAPASTPQGSSLSIKEGWASGLPVLCSDIASHRDIIADGENGLLFRNDDPSNLAAQMTALALDTALQQRLSDGGHSSLALYSCKNFFDKHMQVFESIIGEDTPIENANI